MTIFLIINDAIPSFLASGTGTAAILYFDPSPSGFTLSISNIIFAGRNDEFNAVELIASETSFTIIPACSLNSYGCCGSVSSDCFGICGGISIADCIGECGGSAIEDACGVCNGDNNSCIGADGLSAIAYTPGTLSGLDYSPGALGNHFYIYTNDPSIPNLFYWSHLECLNKNSQIFHIFQKNLRKQVFCFYLNRKKDCYHLS